MDERDDYADLDLPPLRTELQRWHEVARNLLVVGALGGLALILAGLVLVKVAAMRRIRLPEVPAPEASFRSGSPPVRVSLHRVRSGGPRPGRPDGRRLI